MAIGVHHLDEEDVVRSPPRQRLERRGCSKVCSGEGVSRQQGHPNHWEPPGTALSVPLLPPAPSPTLTTSLGELKIYGGLCKCQLWLIIYLTEKLIQENTHTHQGTYRDLASEQSRMLFSLGQSRVRDSPGPVLRGIISKNLDKMYKTRVENNKV